MSEQHKWATCKALADECNEHNCPDEADDESLHKFDGYCPSGGCVNITAQDWYDVLSRAVAEDVDFTEDD